MTIAFWCVLAAALVPYVFVGIAKSAARDNNQPRLAAQGLSGPKQRAYWAHQNSLEVFPAFAAAVIINFLLRGPNPVADMLALAFVVLRLVYGALYMADRATLRSLSWALGIVCIVALFVTA